MSGEELFFAEFGSIKFPFFKMGKIDSTKLFGLDELILFSFYYTNRNRYKKILDLGANIGLHTLIMKKLGFQVISYEPDSVHLVQIEKVMNLNNLNTEGLIPRAISDKRGAMDYIRILGNTTGSHLIGSKEEVYGPTEVVSVEVDDILEVLSEGSFDFVKMDVEGHEVVLLNRITTQSITYTDIMLEIGSEKNAKDIFTIISDKKIPAYAQKINWARVDRVHDLPSHHTHGSLFLSMQGPPNWS
jgi:FkbM family methyltransferase